MLLVGTSHGLRDLEPGEKFLDGTPVTALATDGTEGWYALLDRRSVVRLDRDTTGPALAGELPGPDGQSLAVLPDGTVVVGRTGARLSTLGRDGEVRDVPAFQVLPGREGWENPAGPTPDTRTMAVGLKRWWVNVHVGGVWWSEDAGETWHGAVEAGADVHEVRTGTEGRVAVAAGLPDRFGGNVDSGHLDAAGGRAAIGFGDHLYTSEDSGETWQVAAVLSEPVTAVRFAVG